MEKQTINVVIAGFVGVVIGYFLFKKTIPFPVQTSQKTPSKAPMLTSEEEDSEFCGCGG